MIIGRSGDNLFSKTPVTPGKAIVKVRDLACAGTGPVSFDIRQGELLGLAGLRGAGQELIGRTLFGCEPFAGTVLLHDERPDLSSPRRAMASGIGLIARDRAEESVALSLSIRENTYINPGVVGRGLLSFLSPRGEANLAHAIGRSVGLRPNDPDLPVEALSGGNQQKVVVGRWLATRRKLLVAEDPTAGVDIGARAEIYRLITKAVDAGLAVVVVSTDFEEIAHICHRALVFSRGKIVSELTGSALTTEAVITAASASEAA
jgi:ribose transport system ATP-binding protein